MKTCTQADQQRLCERTDRHVRIHRRTMCTCCGTVGPKVPPRSRWQRVYEQQQLHFCPPRGSSDTLCHDSSPALQRRVAARAAARMCAATALLARREALSSSTSHLPLLSDQARIILETTSEFPCFRHVWVVLPAGAMACTYAAFVVTSRSNAVCQKLSECQRPARCPHVECTNFDPDARHRFCFLSEPRC